jgi:threonyl-tRNA synthetase
MTNVVKISLPDGSVKDYQQGVTALDIAKGIGEGLARAAVAAKFNDVVIDLTRAITTDGTLKILTFKDKEGQEVFRHSAAHILAMAVMRLFPGVKLTIGPAIDDGFYYDIDSDKAFTPEDIVKLEQEIKKIVDEDLVFQRREVSKSEALEILSDNKYKTEMISELGDEAIVIYDHGKENLGKFDTKFCDFCRGPHVPSTGKVKAISLTKVSGAFWRGDAKNKQLQRIYGVAFPSKDELKDYLKLLEEAQKRDHRKIGKEMNLFSIHEEGPGFPFFKNKGMIMWNELISYWRAVHTKWNYQEIKTPIMLSRSLWETSGHWTNYKENMYALKIDDADFAIKPMNCPGGMLIYKEEVHSYKELPIRAGEIGLVHRHEASGALSGLFRVRCFHQDDAHIFMTEAQIKDEILGVLKLAEEMYSTFGLKYHLELSTRPVKSIGTDEAWKISTESLKQALIESGKGFKINEGDGAFYGPKIDIHLKDALGRTWQCGTIQLDMNLPERFDLTYIAEDGSKKRPVMIHRVIYGSLERFFGVIIEHYAGKFPLWLSPVQVKLLPIADRHFDYCRQLKQKMFEAGIRVEIDDKSETTSKKVRDAQMENVNYILVIGDKEVEAQTVSVRTRDNVVHGEKQVDALIAQLVEEIKTRK